MFRLISHDRRRILHSMSRHPTSSWIIQQLREPFPYQSAPKFLVFDRDYGLEVPPAVRSMDINTVRTSFQSPWQNGIDGRRWIEACRQDCWDHVIALGEHRTHLALGKDTPGSRTYYLPVVYHHSREWAGYTIVMIGLLNLISRS